MKRKDKPLGVLICLPLALLGSVLGGFFGFLISLFAAGLTGGGAQSGLFAIFVGAPLGAAIGGVLGFRTARRLR